MDIHARQTVPARSCRSLVGSESIRLLAPDCIVFVRRVVVDGTVTEVQRRIEIKPRDGAFLPVGMELTYRQALELTRGAGE